MFRVLTLWLCLLSPAATAQELEIIVDRSERGIELFLSLAAEDAREVLGTDLATLNGLNVGVDYTVLQNGTWDQGDALFTNVSALVGAEPAVFEAMSMMVHPRDQLQNFTDPIEAMTAISVCGVPIPETPPPLSDMHLYAGFIAYPADGTKPLTLNLGNTAPLQVSVRSFDRAGNSARDVLDVPLNGQIVLPAPTDPGALSIGWVVAIMGLSAVVALGAGMALRQRKSAPII